MLDRGIIENPRLALEFLKEMIIVEARYNFDSKSVNYTAIGECFRKMNDDDKLVPFYRPIYNKKNGSIVMEEIKQ